MKGEAMNTLMPKLMVWGHGLDRVKDYFTCTGKCEVCKSVLKNAFTNVQSLAFLFVLMLECSNLNAHHTGTHF